MNIYHIVALVLPNSSGQKGARVAATLYALDLGANAFQVGMLMAIYALFPLLLAVYAGRVADRYGVRGPLLGGACVMGFGVFMPFLVPGLPFLFISAAVTGLGFIFVQVSMQSLTGSLGSGPARTRNFNLYALAVASADFVGPVLAGVMIDASGHRTTFLVLSLMNLVAVFGLVYFFKRMPHTAVAGGDRSAQRAMDLVRDPQLRRIFIAGAVVFSGIDLFQLFLPLYAHSVGLSASSIGMILGAFAAAAFVVRSMIPWLVRRYGEERTLTYSLYCGAATCVLIPFFSNPLLLAAICFAFGLGMGLGQPLSVMLTYNYSPSGRVGEALGLRIAINNMIHVIVPVAFGGLGSLVGIPPAFWANSLMLGGGGRLSRKR